LVGNKQKRVSCNRNIGGIFTSKSMWAPHPPHHSIKPRMLLARATRYHPHWLMRIRVLIQKTISQLGNKAIPSFLEQDNHQDVCQS